MKRSLTTFLLLAAVAAIAPPSALANCGAAADRDPGRPGVSPKAASRATLCLLNVERRRYHEKRLRSNHKLAIAGARHARDMVRNDYFSHDAPSGRTFVERIKATRYVARASRWSLGENLAWGTRSRATPRQIVRAWMASPAHRANILTARFREIGVAVVRGAPVPGVSDAATYATEFGRVRR
ncbi:MAG: hypothetical protein QOI98_2503 [Solirubrobacteraceae bacterium]|nr:hypothetical protein [Solirubrobacteraceae bacterium]